MRRASRIERQQLRTFERLAFSLAEIANRPPLKRILHRFLATVGKSWVKLGSGKLQRLHGLEHVQGLQPQRGVLLVSNHRSFFDMYVLSSVLFWETRLIRELYFPVRSTFFYERPLGMFINFWLAMMSMYPPILRERERRIFNRYGVEYLIDALSRPGTLVGFHPEGTRGKGDDPLTMLPAQPGAGELAYHARPTVLPVFITGLSNDIVRQVRGNFDGTGGPIDIVFGEPVALDEYLARPASTETYQAIADRLRREILALGAQLQKRSTRAA